MSTTKLGDVLETRPQPTVQKATASNEAKATVQLSKDEIDRTLFEHRDLIAEQFKPWHARQIKRLGISRYMGLASDARRGKRPAQYFSWLLRHTS